MSPLFIRSTRVGSLLIDISTPGELRFLPPPPRPACSGRDEDRTRRGRSGMIEGVGIVDALSHPTHASWHVPILPKLCYRGRGPASINTLPPPHPSSQPNRFLDETQQRETTPHSLSTSLSLSKCPSLFLSLIYTGSPLALSLSSLLSPPPLSLDFANVLFLVLALTFLLCSDREGFSSSIERSVNWCRGGGGGSVRESAPLRLGGEGGRWGCGFHPPCRSRESTSLCRTFLWLVLYARGGRRRSV